MSQTYTGELEIVECAVCHMDFGVTPFFVRDRRRDHATFYCPKGDRNFYAGRSDEEKLRVQLASERERRELAEEQREHAERQKRAARGQVTKIKKRVHNGVCPFCKRTFSDVARHMESKHPEEAPA